MIVTCLLFLQSTMCQCPQPQLQPPCRLPLHHHGRQVSSRRGQRGLQRIGSARHRSRLPENQMDVLLDAAPWCCRPPPAHHPPALSMAMATMCTAIAAAGGCADDNFPPNRSTATMLVFLIIATRLTSNGTRKRPTDILNLTKESASVRIPLYLSPQSRVIESKGT